MLVKKVGKFKFDIVFWLNKLDPRNDAVRIERFFRIGIYFPYLNVIYVNKVTELVGIMEFIVCSLACFKLQQFVVCEQMQPR